MSAEASGYAHPSVQVCRPKRAVCRGEWVCRSRRAGLALASTA